MPGAPPLETIGIPLLLVILLYVVFSRIFDGAVWLVFNLDGRFGPLRKRPGKTRGRKP